MNDLTNSNDKNNMVFALGKWWTVEDLDSYLKFRSRWTFVRGDYE